MSTATTARRMTTARTPAAKVGVAEKLGTNLNCEVVGDELIIRINLSERHGPSASGKTTIVATSGGNQKVPGTEVIIGVNAYVKP